MTEEVALRLAETVAWCNLHARADDADASTRSPALCPPVMTLPQRQRLSWLLDRPGEPQAAVEFVCQARRRELARLGIPVVPVGPDLAGGRVLFTTIDTDSCEAAAVPTRYSNPARTSLEYTPDRLGPVTRDFELRCSPEGPAPNELLQPTGPA